ncbi:Hsp20/alpha crystallin family protein [Candidatus Woesearchaeota archaeon]|nr:MAG: Hsp20/alpha crystallin family protein [Candidatus Woesearchaeota archaeon]
MGNKQTKKVYIVKKQLYIIKGGGKMAKELWDPFKEMEEFRKKVDKMFNDFWSTSVFPKNLRIREPLVDVIDNKNAYVAKIDLPGVDPKNVVVNIDKNKVEVKAENKVKKEEKKKNYFKKERSYTGFYKAFTLPEAVNAEKTKMDFKDGVLSLTLPKLKLPKKKVLRLK